MVAQTDGGVNVMAPNEQKGGEATETLETPQAIGGLARAVVMSAILGVVLLAALPSLAGYRSSGGGAEPNLPPLLSLVRGI